MNRCGIPGIDDGSVHWIFDCGHGWLRVPVVSCEGLRFSEYSYYDRQGGWVYLEEDCDAGVWLDAHGIDTECAGLFIRAEFVEGDAFVRSLPRLTVVGGAS